MKNVPIIAIVLVSALVFESPKTSASMREEERIMRREGVQTRRMTRIAELDELRDQKTKLRSQLRILKKSTFSDRPNILRRLRFPDEIKRLEDLVREQGGDPGNMVQTLRIQEVRIKKERRKSFLTGLVLGGASYFLLRFFAHTPSPADITMAPTSLPSTSSEPTPLAFPYQNGTDSLMEEVTSTQSSFEGIDPHLLIRPQSPLLPEGLSPLSGLEGSPDPSTALISYEAPSNFLPSQPMSGIATATTPASSGPSINLTNLIPTEGQSTVIPDSNLTAVPASSSSSINLTNLIPTEGQPTTIPDSRIYGSRGAFERLARFLRTPYRWIYGRS